MPTPPGGERAARLRAMHGYSGLDQKDLAPLLGVSVTTLSRMENGRTTVSDDDLKRAARECGVPEVFVEVGWAPLEAPIDDTERRLYEFEGKVNDRLERIEAALADGPQVDYTRLGIEFTRRLKATGAETANADPTLPPAAPSRDAADATPEPPEAPGEETPDSELGAGG